MNSNQELNEKIEYLRIQMIETGMKNGLNSPATVKISRELDFLLMLSFKEKNLLNLQHSLTQIS